MEPYLAQILMWGPYWAPRYFALCHGQLLAVAQNEALFQLIGTIYGGDGRTTFGLPDMRGRIPLHHGSGPGLTPRIIGSKGGAESVTLTISNLPSHNHSVNVSTDDATATAATGNMLAKQFIYEDPAGSVSHMPMNMNTIGTNTGNQSHENRMPIECISFIIALEGIYPSRN